jgi:hypothetical protein
MAVESPTQPIETVFALESIRHSDAVEPLISDPGSRSTAEEV